MEIVKGMVEERLREVESTRLGVFMQLKISFIAVIFSDLYAEFH